MERIIITNSLAKKLTAAITLTFGIAFSAPTAKAVVIVPGDPPQTPTGIVAPYSGIPIFSVTTPFVGTLPVLNTVSFTGSLTSQVYVGSGGKLDFVYQFSDDNNPNNDAIERFTVDGFTGFTTDADYIPSTGVDAPELVTRQDSITGDVVGYQFAGVNPGENTDILVIQTNATAYQTGDASFQDGGNVSIPAPVPAVPEPATIGLLVISLSALNLRRNRA
jgi:hypothetical protein